jgi:hypothetical protein
MKPAAWLVTAGFLLSMTFNDAVFAQQSSAVPPQSGGVPVRVPSVDGLPTQCIDASKDRVWLTLRRLITTKGGGWFRKDNSVEVVINAQVRTDPPPAKPLSFPLTTEAKFGDAPSGQFSVPIEYPIVSGLALTQGDVTYTGVGVAITLLNLQDRTKLGSALQALSTITSSAKLPIPASPYTQGLTYLLDFANTAVTNDITAHNKDDKAVSGALDFNFDPDGKCNGDFETTGTKAIIFSAGIQGPGLIDIRQTGDYCWSADLTSTFVLKAAKKEGSIPCQDRSYDSKYKEPTNNYIAFFLNKRTVSKKLGPDSDVERDRQESLSRCQANGITERSQCPGWNP